MTLSLLRTRWAAIGAAVAVSLGAGGIGISQATTSSGERPIYVPIEPCRLADTRPAFQVGPRSAPLGPNETYPLAGWGKVGGCNLPGGTTGLSLNVTAVDPTLATFLTLFPASSTLPNASHLNPMPGQPPTPNAVNVDLDGAGLFSIYNLQGSVHVIIDVVGYFDHHIHDDRYYTEAESDGRYYTKSVADSRYVSAKQDTFYYVPGSMLEIHVNDGPATVHFDNSSDAIVRKTVSAGTMQVLIPVPFPARLGGAWGKLVDYRVSYKVDNVNSYITSTRLIKSNNSGAHVDIGWESTDRKSTTYSSYVVNCFDPGCQLDFVPNGNYVTVLLELDYGGIGDPHDITIGGVLLRVSYDG